MASPALDMGTAAWIGFALSLVRSLWMTFDGARAFALGDYVTPKTGAYAGQLGPWSRLVSAVGLDPRSALVKFLFVALGLAGLVACGAFALHAPWGRGAVLATAVATLWYAPLGTAVDVVVLAVLLLT